MVFIAQLWLPILVSAVIVFIASSLVHAVLPFHARDYAKMPNEDDVLEAMHTAGVPPGDYLFPYAPSPKAMQAPEMVKKLERGPLGFVTVMPTGVPTMGGQLVQWFVYCVLVGIVTAYVTGRTFGPGVDYLAIFRISGTVAFIAYSGAHPSASIWYRRSWSTTARFIVDGFLYGLLTAGTFGWLWPR
jgi:hypothetical protein